MSFGSSTNRPVAFLSAKPARVGVVCDYVEEGWLSMDLAAEMTIGSEKERDESSFAPSRLRPRMKRRASLFRGLERGALAWNADRAINRYWDYPRWLKKRQDEFDLFHIVDHSYGHLAHHLPPERTVITCHDLDAFQCLFDADRSPRKAMIRALAGRTLAGLKLAARVICVSDATRNQILKNALLPPERLVVIKNAIDPVFTSQADVQADLEAERLLENSGARSIDLLHVGSVAPRKRIDVLLRVIAAVRRELPETRLVRVGGALSPEQSGLADELGVRDRILELPFLDRKTLAAIYRRVALVVLTSDAEGFGLPLAEAMACGAATTASDIPAFREVGEDVPTYCAVGDVEAWRTGILELLREREANPVMWASRRRRGVEQAAQFDWDAYEGRLAEVYRQVLLADSSDFARLSGRVRQIEKLGLQ